MPIKYIALGLFVFACIATPTRSAHALSCVQPEGDQVLLILETQKQPLWFGKATLISTDKAEDAENNDPFVAKFQIEDTYLSIDASEMNEKVDVKVSQFHQTWGMWGAMYSSKTPIKVGDTGEYAFNLDSDGHWNFFGPGGCTYFSDTEWEGLRSGFYNDQLDEDNKDNQDAD